MKTRNDKQNNNKDSSSRKRSGGSASRKVSIEVHTKLKKEDLHVIADVLSKSKNPSAALVEIAARHNKLVS